MFLRAEMDYNLPEFGSILKIVILPTTKVFFYIKKFITLENDNNFHTFQVKLKLNPDITLIEQDQLATYLPAHTVRAFGSEELAFMLLQGLLFVVYNCHKCVLRSPLSCAMEHPTSRAHYSSPPGCFAF